MGITSEYLNELADIADPEMLWRLNPFDQMKLPPEARRQLDTGVALRRYAEHLGRLENLIGTGISLVITPISRNGNAVMTIPAPESHKRILDKRAGAQP